MTLYPIFVTIPQQSMMLESLKSKPPFLSECLYPSSFCQFIFFEPLLAVASFYESVQAIRPATTTRPRGDKHSTEDKQAHHTSSMLEGLHNKLGPGMLSWKPVIGGKRSCLLGSKFCYSFCYCFLALQDWQRNQNNSLAFMCLYIYK